MNQNSSFNKATISKSLRQILLYLCLFILFRTVFVLIIPEYIAPTSTMKGPIDARTMEYKFFDEEYVELAKNGGYNICGYFEVYVPLDIAFPILYTIMFLSALVVFKNKTFYKAAVYLIFAGMILDYLENFTFSIYLKSSLNLSSLVAFFTTIKAFIFLINLVVFVFAVGYAIVLLFKQSKIRIIKH